MSHCTFWGRVFYTLWSHKRGSRHFDFTVCFSMTTRSASSRRMVVIFGRSRDQVQLHGVINYEDIGLRLYETSEVQ
jgi:hypothetical protein